MPLGCLLPSVCPSAVCCPLCAPRLFAALCVPLSCLLSSVCPSAVYCPLCAPRLFAALCVPLGCLLPSSSVSPSQNPLVQPIVTPRFAPTCSSELLKSLGELAKEMDVHIQSHICEQKPEVEYTLKLFPDHKHSASIFDKNGLLTDKVCSTCYRPTLKHKVCSTCYRPTLK